MFETRPKATLATAFLLTVLGAGACAPANETAAEAPVGTTVEEHGEMELAVLMGELQRHTSKLGYSIAGTHQALADFYLAETQEVVEQLRAVETYEGLLIAKPTQTILDPLLPPLAEAIAAANGISNPNRIRVGQVLKIPTSR